MNYQLFIYVIVTLTIAYTLSGINFNNFFKKGKTIEAKLFVVILILSLSYLVSNFFISFIEISKIL